MPIVVESGINIGPGITIEGGPSTPAPTLMLNLDAAGYSSGPWVDTVASRSFTLYNGVSYSADGGGSLVFDPASSQYAECTSSLSDLSTWTVVAWHYYAGTNTGVAPTIITEKFPSTTNQINYSLGCLLGSANTDIQSGFFNGAWRSTATGTSLIPGQWGQVVGTYDGSTIKLYINSTLVETQSYSGTPISGGSGIRLMRRWDDANYWGGKLAIVQVYDGAMTSGQVTTNFNNNYSRFVTAGVNNVTGYSEMNPPVIPGNQLEDGTATINGSTGFTINDDGATGVAIPALTASNDAWFSANYTAPGTYTCHWGPGSTVASSSINVVFVTSTTIVFYIQGQTGAATYNYPFVFS